MNINTAKSEIELNEKDEGYGKVFYTMKTKLLILTLLFWQVAFGQFALIADKDGFVNVRSAAGTSNEIIDTVHNGQIVFCLEAENDWYPVDYDLSNKQKSGYIHKSRVKFIEGFKKIPFTNITDSTILFKQDTLSLAMAKEAFHIKKNKLQYHKGDPQKNEVPYLEKINNLKIWGTDGNVPKRQYVQVLLKLGNRKIYLPQENLFEPNLNNTSINIDTQNGIIYVTALNSDGAGAYDVLWIVEKGKYKQRIIAVPFGLTLTWMKGLT